MPHHSAPRLGSGCPPADLKPWAAATGHPWPNAANPASCRVTHGFRSAFGQRGLTGRLRSTSKARRPESRPDCFSFPVFCRSCPGLHGTALSHSKHRSVGASGRRSDLPANKTTRYISPTALSFFAGKPRSNRNHRDIRQLFYV